MLRAWQQWTQDRPPEGHGYVQLITGDPAGDGATVSVELTFVGSPERAKTLAADFVAATGSDPIRTRELSGSFVSTERDWLCAGLRPEECGYAGITPGGTIPRDALTAKSDFVFKPWPDKGLALIIDAIARRQADRVLTPSDFRPGVNDGKVLIEVCGGAIDAVAPDASAFAHRGALYLSQYQARWQPGADEAVVAANVAWTREMFASVAAYRSGASYVNYADPDFADWPQAYYGANLAKQRDQGEGRPRQRFPVPAVDPAGLSLMLVWAAAGFPPMLGRNTVTSPIAGRNEQTL